MTFFLSKENTKMLEKKQNQVELDVIFFTFLSLLTDTICIHVSILHKEAQNLQKEKHPQKKNGRKKILMVYIVSYTRHANCTVSLCHE